MAKTKATSVLVDVGNQAVATPATLPVEYLAGVDKFMFTEPYHLFDEADLDRIRQRTVSSKGASVGGVDVELVVESLPVFAEKNPILVLQALENTKQIAASLFPNASIAWERDPCDASRLVFLVHYNAGDELSPNELYARHQEMLARFLAEVTPDVRRGVSLERIID